MRNLKQLLQPIQHYPMAISTLSATEAAIEIIRQFYAAVNRMDFDFVRDTMDAGIIRNEFEGLPGAGNYSGREEVLRHLVTSRSTWAEGACKPQEFFTADHKIVVTVHVKVRIGNNDNWIDTQITDGFVINNGLITEFHSFATSEKAFEWAGIMGGDW